MVHQKQLAVCCFIKEDEMRCGHMLFFLLTSASGGLSFFLSWRDGTGAEFLLAFACASRDGDDVGTRMCFGAGGMDRDTEST